MTISDEIDKKGNQKGAIVTVIRTHTLKTFREIQYVNIEQYYEPTRWLIHPVHL